MMMGCTVTRINDWDHHTRVARCALCVAYKIYTHTSYSFENKKAAAPSASYDVVYKEALFAEMAFTLLLGMGCLMPDAVVDSAETRCLTEWI